MDVNVAHDEIERVLDALDSTVIAERVAVHSPIVGGAAMSVVPSPIGQRLSGRHA